MIEKGYTVEEVAEISGLTTMSVYRHIWQKKLKAHKIGNEWRIKYKDLRVYLGED